MKKLVSYFVLIVFIFSCSSDDNNSPVMDDNTNAEDKEETVTPPEDSQENINASFETIPIIIDVVLPDNIDLGNETLSVSTLEYRQPLTPENSVTTEVYDSEGYEIVFLEDEMENPILFGLLNPTTMSSFQLNVESTSLALIMLHPWALNFTSNAKTEVMNYLKTHPNFNAFMAQVEDAIITKDFISVDVDAFLLATFDNDNGTTDKDELLTTKTPFQINVSNGMVRIENQATINYYGAQLYNEEGVNINDFKVLNGISKELISLNSILNVFEGKLPSFNPTQVSLEVPADGKWELRLKSGLPLLEGSQENNRALILNVGRFFANIFGLFSARTKKALLEEDCLISIGLFFLGETQNLLEDFYRNRDNTTLIRKMLNVFGSIGENSLGIVNDCILASFEDSFFKSLFLSFSQIDKVQSASNLGFIFADWVRFDNSVEFCFEQQENEVFYCDGIIVSGDLNFGDLGIGLTQQTALKITNNLDVAVAVQEIQLPEGFTADWVSGTIAPNVSQNVLITFAPAEVIEYKGVILVKTDAVSETLEYSVSGVGVENEDSGVNLFELLTSSGAKGIGLSNCASIRVWTETARPDLNTRTEDTDCPPGYSFVFNTDGTFTVTNSPITQPEFAVPGTFSVNGNSFSMSFQGSWTQSDGRVNQQRSYSYAGTYNELTGRIEGTGSFFTSTISESGSGNVTTLEYTYSFDGSL